MADKLIGSLIYGDHPEPKKARSLIESLKVPVSIGTFLLVGGGLLYNFINYREESRVTVFLESVATSEFEAAYSMWDGDERYLMKDFLLDWGEEGFYTKGPMNFDICDSNSAGATVVVYVRIDGRYPVAILVDKENLLLSYAPDNKYISGMVSRSAGCLP
jgi:hypothetical protein